MSLARLPEAERARILQVLTPEEVKTLRHEWRFWARKAQLQPDGIDWQFWLVLAGRGFGKSRTGAEWVNEQVERHGAKRIALVAETAADARDVMVEGESGILACAPPWFRPTYQPTKRRLTWPNGAIATTFTAEKPDQLRGPQHDLAWADELAKWRFAKETWDQLMFGLRLGKNPRAVITTTPRPIRVIKDLLADPLCRITRGSTDENRANLAPQFITAILKRYRGTRLGRQELDAEVIDDAPGALWSREQLEKLYRAQAPELVRIVVAVDPSVSAGNGNETDDPSAMAGDPETGIIAVGLGVDEEAYVLADDSLLKPSPDAWGKQAVATYSKLKADRIIGEVNNGGDLVESNIRAIDKNVPFAKVHASRGKAVRAEPISALYEQGRVHHVGSFPILEDQMCQWEPGVSTWSPNRVDALVWALTELMIDSGGDMGELIGVQRTR